MCSKYAPMTCINISQKHHAFVSHKLFSSKSKDKDESKLTNQESLLDRQKERIKKDYDISLDELDKKLEEQLDELHKKNPEKRHEKVIPEFKDIKEAKSEGEKLDPTFMNFSTMHNKSSRSNLLISWKSAGFVLLGLGLGVGYLQYLDHLKKEEKEKQKIMQLGKAKIGGDWELINTEGKLERSQDLKGNWLLIYFGFTHCPDICPEEIEKMVKITSLLEKNREWTSLGDKAKIVPVFISVDPERDTVARVKKYCEEFSPKIRGYTGSSEQVPAVCKTFRVYHSKGPATTDKNDYIVDHTVIMYLIDPEGKFLDYYGNNRSAEEIADTISKKAYTREVLSKKKGLFSLSS
uniref:Thioredoxin domain-containing protein n=1 Tax=Acrobeloides nanus TaxID=290746 RepID=A0A914DLL5_9BILA